MASEKINAMIEEVKALTVLELAELVHALEEAFGTSRGHGAVLPWVRCRLETRLHVATCLAEALNGEMDAELPPTPQDGSGCLREDAGKDASQEELGDRSPCSQCH